MSLNIHKLQEPQRAKPLFGDWQETVIWSATDGIMGDVYANDALTAACAVLGDFAFIASPKTDEDALQALLHYLKRETDHDLILVAQDEALFALCKKLLGNVQTGWRYGFRKDNTFEPEKLRGFVAELPESYVLSGMTPEIWAQAAEKKGWMKDFISNFPDYDTFQNRALLENAPLHTLSAGERAILSRLRTMTDEEFETLPYGSEGLWRKFMHACRSCNRLEEIVAATKSKRYTHTRIDRMVMCAFLGITKDILEAPAPYTRVLAFNDTGRSVLKQAKQHTVCINAGEAFDHPYWELEKRWGNLYGLFCADGIEAPGEEESRRVYYHKEQA